MPNPHDTLTIFADISVALAGFSGIAIAFGRRSVGALTSLESRRLFNLFTFSGLVLILSLLGMSLLHVDLFDVNSLARGGSAVLVLFGVPWLILDWRKVCSLKPEERSQVPGQVIYPFIALAILTLILQLVNVFVLGAAWPFFVALVLLVAFAFQQFILLIRMGLRDA